MLYTEIIDKKAHKKSIFVKIYLLSQKLFLEPPIVLCYNVFVPKKRKEKEL